MLRRACGRTLRVYPAYDNDKVTRKIFKAALEIAKSHRARTSSENHIVGAARHCLVLAMQQSVARPSAFKTKYEEQRRRKVPASTPYLRKVFEPKHPTLLKKLRKIIRANTK